MISRTSPAAPGRGRRGDGPDPIDIHVGSRIRLRRKMLGFSQGRLGDALGLTFQQVQKYERGTNRAGASRLHELSKILDVPISFFFDDQDPVRAPAMPTGFAEEPAPGFHRPDPLKQKETIELVDAFSQIEDARLRRRLFQLLQALVSEPAPRNRRGRPRRSGLPVGVP
jgi:transcriptional regulator with XRE-family HTH domain